MSREMLNLKQAAEHVHLSVNDLRHFAQRGELEATERGDDWFFEHRALDEWAQRNLIASNHKNLKSVHQTMMEEHQKSAKIGWNVADLFKLDGISLELSAKTKAGALRDMTTLADKTGLLYDPEALFSGLTEREAIASTAVGNSIALLHPRFHDPYLFEESFVAYARAINPIFFGAPDGESTRHFFLICSTDHDLHLHILARLAMLAHGTTLMESLDAAESNEDVIAALRSVEKDFI